MKSVVVHRQGGPEELVVEDGPGPLPGPGEVLVEVGVAGVNFIDVYHRRGVYPIEFPLTPGVEGAGVVIEVGEGVQGVVAGDRVGWVSALGSYRERHVVPAKQVVGIPRTLDLEVATALLLQGMTAHYLATDTYRLAEGSKCLIHAGAGGVGLLLTQVAKLRGATVITTVGSEEKAELSRQAGADMVVEYRDVDFVEAVEGVYGPNALDVVYDGVGADTFEGGLDLIRPRGTMVTFGNASGVVPPFSPLVLGSKGSLFLTRPSLGHYTATREELMGRAEELFDWAGDGLLTVRIGGRYTLQGAADAHRDLESRKTIGKLLVLPPPS